MLGARLVFLSAVFVSTFLIGWGECRRRPRPSTYRTESTPEVVTEEYNELKMTRLEITGCYENEGPDPRVFILFNDLIGPFTELRTTTNNSEPITDDNDVLCVKGSWRTLIELRFEPTRSADLMKIMPLFREGHWPTFQSLTRNRNYGFSDSMWELLWEYFYPIFKRSQVARRLTKEGQERTVGWFFTNDYGSVVPVYESVDGTSSTTSTETTEPVTTMGFLGCVLTSSPFNAKAFESILRTEDSSTSAPLNVLETAEPNDDDSSCSPPSHYEEFQMDIRSDKGPGVLLQQVLHVFEEDYQPPREVDLVKWEEMKELFSGRQTDSSLERRNASHGFTYGWHYGEPQDKRLTLINGSRI